MSQLDDILSKYVDTSAGTAASLLGAALIVKGKEGKTLYSNAVGKLNFEADSPPFTVDSVGWIASMSKLVTAVAVLQVVEKGLIGLDDDIGKAVPRFANVDVLEGFDDNGKPKMGKQNKPITLRHLLTHSSGLGYDAFNPKLVQWALAVGRPTNSHGPDGLEIPLLFQPGEDWEYGIGLDWAGQIIEHLTGLTLGDYMRENIFTPLDMKSTTFRILDRPDLAERRAALPLRAGPGTPLVTGESPQPDDVSLDWGGGGLHSTAKDYSQLLGALVSGGGGILKPQSVAQLYTPQLPDNSHLMKHTNGEFSYAMCPEYPPGIPANYGLGGAVNLEDIPGKRRKGSVMWSGYSNPHWWFDPQTGIAAVFFTQVLPPGDNVAIALYDELEKAVYKELVSG